MRLLLAEDERELSAALCAILTHNNYSVDAVYNGRDALDYLTNGNYDAAILDIMMPETDGLTVLRRAREAGCKLPILILTAKSEVDDRVRGLDLGADDYLTKPFAARELLARIRAMTRRPGEISSTVLQYENLSLDRATFELSTPSGVFRLGNREFQIMEMLLENPGQIIPTERFLEKIWGYDTESDVSVVWVNISYLRKKLDALGAQVTIRATRGVGYSLEGRRS
ncbi:MAG: response regulator transcription factor [Eubacteriales bacterium]|nr:response regulator transcription factor [Clostridiales bacterium]MDY3072805.1 response regulator transcription factor [Eubacteriales bacterium]MDY3287266.1 response regulator transcription factor [Eubacteriales bacterium]MDY5015158.1 response regulator transcription factor [Eubacteriales bacterium]